MNKLTMDNYRKESLMNIKEKPPIFKHILTLVISGTILLLIYKLLSAPVIFTNALAFLSDVLSAITIGLVLAFLLCPIYNGSTKLFYNFFAKSKLKQTTALKISKVIATIIAISSFIGATTAFFWLVTPELIDSIIGITEVSPDRYTAFVAWAEETLAPYPDIQHHVTFITNTLYEKVLTWINEDLLAQ